MASVAVFDAVMTLLAANWSHTAIVDGSPFSSFDVPSNGAAFAEVTFPFASEQRISFGAPGNNVFRENGAFVFSVMAPVSDDVRDWLLKLDALRDALRGASAVSGNLRIDEAPPPILDNIEDREIYRVVSIAVPYEFDTFS